MMRTVRTTVTLDDDLAASLRRLAAERGTGFRDTINAVLRVGLGAERAPRPYRTPTRNLGARADVDLTKALALAGAQEDEETLREMRVRK